MSEIKPKSNRRAVRPYRNDGYANMLNKYGTKQDSSEAYKFEREPLIPDTQLTTLYEGNGLFAKIIDTPAEEAVKHGFSLNLNNEDLDQYVEESLDELDWDEKATTAIKWARLYGGSIIVMLIDDGRGLEDPVDWQSIRSIDELRVFERAVVQPDYTSLYRQDFGGKGKANRISRFGEPEYYMVSSMYGSFTVHESRCLVFRNGVLPEQVSNSTYQMWGMPEYVRIKRVLRETTTAHTDATRLLERSVQAVYSMKNLSQILATDDGEDAVVKRLQLIDMARNLLNSIAIDADGETYEFKSYSFSGVKDVIDATCNMLSALTNIPQTILFGRSPAGMDATGQSDMENYYNFIERIQKLMLKKNLRYLLDVVFRAGVASKEIESEPDYKLEFKPLWNLSETEQAGLEQTKAATAMTKAQTAQLYIDMQVIDASEVRKKLASDDEFVVEDIIESADEDLMTALYGEQAGKVESDVEAAEKNAEQQAVAGGTEQAEPETQSSQKEQLQAVKGNNTPEPQNARESAQEERETQKDDSHADGGPGSGNFGHAGRPGKRGGSASKSGGGAAGAAGAGSGGWQEINKPMTQSKATAILSGLGHDAETISETRSAIDAAKAGDTDAYTKISKAIKSDNKMGKALADTAEIETQEFDRQRLNGRYRVIDMHGHDLGISVEVKVKEPGENKQTAYYPDKPGANQNYTIIDRKTGKKIDPRKVMNTGGKTVFSTKPGKGDIDGAFEIQGDTFTGLQKKKPEIIMAKGAWKKHELIDGSGSPEVRKMLYGTEDYRYIAGAGPKVEYSYAKKDGETVRQDADETISLTMENLYQLGYRPISGIVDGDLSSPSGADVMFALFDYAEDAETSETSDSTTSEDSLTADGGPGSGNWGHSGVHGHRGGSAPGGGSHNRQTDPVTGGYTSFAKQKAAAAKPHSPTMEELDAYPVGTVGIDKKTGTKVMKQADGWYIQSPGGFPSKMANPGNLTHAKTLSLKIPDTANKNYNKDPNSSVIPQSRKDAAMRHESQDVVDGALRDDAGKVWKSLDNETKDALFGYTGPEYIGDNKYLRGDQSYDYTKERCEKITAAIDKTSLPDMWVQRGIQMSAADKLFGLPDGTLANAVHDPNALRNILIDRPGCDPGFMSVGATEGLGFDWKKVQLHIFVPQGTKGIYAEPFSANGDGHGRSWDGEAKQHHFGDEFEIILQRGTKVHVTNAWMDNNGQLQIECEVTGQQYDPLP